MLEPTPDLYAVIGDTVRSTCRLKRGIDGVDERVNASHLYFLPRDGYDWGDRSTQTIVDEDSIQLTLSDVKKEDEGSFFCFINSTSVYGKEDTHGKGGTINVGGESSTNQVHT